MSKKLYEENNIRDIANAIREQNGLQDSYTVAQMGNAVRAIKTQPSLEVLSATQNGNYLPSAGKDGFSSVNVNVEGEEPVIHPLSATENGIYTPPSGVDGYAPVTVNVSGGSGILQPKIVTANGQYVPDTGYDGFSGVDVYVTEGSLEFGTPVDCFDFNTFKNCQIINGSATWENDSFILTATSNDCYTRHDSGNNTKIQLPYTGIFPCIFYLTWDYEFITNNGTENNSQNYIFRRKTDSESVTSPPTRKFVTTYSVNTDGISYYRIRFGVITRGDSIRYKNIHAGYIPLQLTT